MEIISRDGGIVLVDTVETPFVIEEAEAKAVEMAGMAAVIAAKIEEMQSERDRIRAEALEVQRQIAAVREFMETRGNVL